MNLLTHTCILVLTRVDGTLLDATSVQVEDIVKICVSLGHTHPDSVLRYLAMELVMLFHTMDDMIVVAQRVVKATTLCEEAIKVRISQPS